MYCTVHVCAALFIKNFHFEMLSLLSSINTSGLHLLAISIYIFLITFVCMLQLYLLLKNNIHT